MYFMDWTSSVADSCKLQVPAPETSAVKYDAGSALDDFFANNTLKVTDQAEHDQRLAKLREKKLREKKLETETELEEEKRRVEELEKELKIHREFFDVLSVLTNVLKRWIN